jgi:hypothetical protein
MIEHAGNFLKFVLGYDVFISLQREVIANILRGKDTLAVMPIGLRCTAGKEPMNIGTYPVYCPQPCLTVHPVDESPYHTGTETSR